MRWKSTKYCMKITLQDVHQRVADPRVCALLFLSEQLTNERLSRPEAHQISKTPSHRETRASRLLNIVYSPTRTAYHTSYHKRPKLHVALSQHPRKQTKHKTATMTTYLSKQKKGDLIELAKQAGVTGYVCRAQCNAMRQHSR
jgi:hypothetical protein